MTKVICPLMTRQNDCKHNNEGVCSADEIEMNWEIVAGCILYYCMTEEGEK